MTPSFEVKAIAFYPFMLQARVSRWRRLWCWLRRRRLEPILDLLRIISAMAQKGY